MAIEIDSLKGVTTKRLSYLFDKVASVESDKALHEIATRRCAKRKNADLLLGAYREAGLGSKLEPKLRELGRVLPYLKQVKAAVVDYFRSLCADKDLPRKSEVIDKLEMIFPEPA